MPASRLRPLATLAAALAITVAVVLWVRSVGGPEAVSARYGAWALAVTVPAHIATTLTPLGEFIPFGVANGSLYGLAAGAVLNGFVWMVAATAQYAFGRSAAGAEAASGGPEWLKRWPLTHPLVLACGRWLPGGGPLVDAAAGAAGVPFARAMGLAALGHAPQAVAVAAVGAGLVA